MDKKMDIFDWLHDMMKEANNATKVLVVKNDEPVAYGELDFYSGDAADEQLFEVEGFHFAADEVDRVNDEAYLIYMK